MELNMPAETRPLKRKPGIAKNIAWNFFGQGTPLASALIAVPLLIHHLGTERFGVLSLAWMVIGYFSLFDFGLGRAITKLVAERLGNGRDEENPALVWTGLCLLGGVGVFSALLIALLTPWLTGGTLRIPAALVDESRAAFYILAGSVPLVVTTVGLRAVLDAHHRFDLGNMIRLPLGLWTFLSPLAVLPFSHSLRDIVWVLLVGRIAALFAHIWACYHIRPDLFRSRALRKDAVHALVSFGGWITVSNIVSPVMLYFDRFLIGATLSVAAVAYYTTPYEVVTRFGLVPDAIISVLFPTFAALLYSNNARAVETFDRAMRGLILIIFPVCLLVCTLAYDALALWISTGFSEKSFRVAQWLAAGLLCNAVARLPYAVVQAAGKARYTALLHLTELPLYLALLWGMVTNFGIVGAAFAWFLRAALDMLALLVLACRVLPALGNAARRGVLLLGFCGVALLIGTYMPTLLWRVVYLLAVLSTFLLLGWKSILSANERQSALSYLRLSKTYKAAT
jgi:O-antigen/teichoic acid export membrane protein